MPLLIPKPTQIIAYAFSASASLFIQWLMLFLAVTVWVPAWLKNGLTGFMWPFTPVPHMLDSPVTLVGGLSNTYCNTIGWGCNVPFLPLDVDPRLFYANSANVQAHHLSELTSGLTLIMHPSSAPLHSDALAKMSAHIRYGSTSPSKEQACKLLDRFKVATQQVEDALYDASGIVAVRLDTIIDGVDHLHTMLKDPAYSEDIVRRAHDQFLIELDRHLGAISDALAITREATSLGRATGEAAYETVVKIVSDVNLAIEKRRGWFPGITGVQKSALLQEKEMTHQTKQGVEKIWETISLAEASVKKMRSYISAYRHQGARELWAHQMGLSVRDAVMSLGKFVEMAKRDRHGDPRLARIADARPA